VASWPFEALRSDLKPNKHSTIVFGSSRTPKLGYSSPQWIMVLQEFEIGQLRKNWLTWQRRGILIPESTTRVALKSLYYWYKATSSISPDSDIRDIPIAHIRLGVQLVLHLRPSSSNMPSAWISLPASWKLEDVQAALNVIIAALSALGIFAFVRTCWLFGAKKITQNNVVPLPSLLSLNTLGDALDIILLLRRRLIAVRNLAIVGQCLVVACLSSTAILSGVISRYSTARGHAVTQEEVPGLMASRQHNGMSYANVEWNLTHSRLDKAGFPRDRLLDFLPSNAVEWVYREDEWNSSWSFDCHLTPQTSIDLYVTDNCTGWPYEIPDLNQVISYEEWTAAVNGEPPRDGGWWTSSGGFYNSRTTIKDELLFIYALKGGDYTDAGDTFRSMNISIASVHMHNLGRSQNSTDDCIFSKGPVESSYYTKIDCRLQQHEPVEDVWNVAFPDVYYPGNVPEALTEYYQARFTQQSTSDSHITVITPEELVRFYQAYTIVKDAQYPQPVTRTMSVDRPVVLISTAFLALAVLVAFLILLGMLNYGIFSLRYHTLKATIPQSKLDWMLQSVEAEDRPLTDAHGRTRKSVTVDLSGEIWTLPDRRRRRMELENAKYGQTETTTWFLRDSGSSSKYRSSPPASNKSAFVSIRGQQEDEQPQESYKPMLSSTTAMPIHQLWTWNH
jgi:hypothetical protein